MKTETLKREGGKMKEKYSVEFYPLGGKSQGKKAIALLKRKGQDGKYVIDSHVAKMSRSESRKHISYDKCNCEACIVIRDGLIDGKFKGARK